MSKAGDNVCLFYLTVYLPFSLGTKLELVKNYALILKKSEFVFKILAHNLFSREYKSFHFRASHDGPKV